VKDYSLVVLRGVLRSAGVVAALAMVTGCSSTGEPAPEGPSPYDPEALRFQTHSYSLAPGEEKYLCYTFELPEEGIGAITKIQPQYGAAVHHTFFAYTLNHEDEAAFECPQLFAVTWVPLYLGGVDSDPLVLPEGAGMRVLTKQLLLQLHLQKTSGDIIEDTTTIHVSTVAEDESIVPAGIFGFDNQKIDVPPGAEGVSTSMECEPGRDMEVFGVLGHMHKHGETLALTRVTDGAADVLYQADWSFDDQPVAPVSLTLSAEDRVRLDCTHSNPTESAVTWGESSDQEMCAAVLYYTPFDGLDGCVETPGQGN
jgi:hypothetical protein